MSCKVISKEDWNWIKEKVQEVMKSNEILMNMIEDKNREISELKEKIQKLKSMVYERDEFIESQKNEIAKLKGSIKIQQEMISRLAKGEVKKCDRVSRYDIFA